MERYGYRLPRLLLNSNIDVPPANRNRTSSLSFQGNDNFDGNMMIILAAVLCALICALGLNSIVRCALRCSRRFAYEINDEIVASNTGMKKETLSHIPVVVYRSELRIPATDCPICLGEFMEGENVRILPKCNHGFRVKCIDRWLVLHSSCPTCRQSLTETCSVNCNVEHVRRVHIIS